MKKPKVKLSLIKSVDTTLLNFSIQMKKTKLKGQGVIQENKAEVMTSLGYIDLSELGPFAGVEVLGHGPGELFFYEDDLENISALNLKINAQDFSVVNLDFGKVDTDLKIDLENDQINVKSLKGKKDLTDYQVRGTFYLDDRGLDIDFFSSNSRFKDLKSIFSNVLDPWLNKQLDYIKAESRFSAQVYGPYDIDVMKIKGNLEGDSVNVKRENFDKFQIGFDYEKKLLRFNPIYLKKLKSSLFFNGELDFENDIASYQLRADELNLRDFYYFVP